ncbi:GNAT family N-acetyltransferase [Pilimelia columellifera]|uniref:GNAT family N-acetyltransferase n=1 Tax=Pilimelia columellifera subsp. columellifera TaxID=706583 RepID=A0ABN3N7D2_9ACTN
MADIRVRHAQPEDHDAVVRLTLAAYRRDGQLAGPSGDYAATLADVAARTAVAEVLVATDDLGLVLGSVTLTPYGSPLADLARPGEGGFRMLAVDPVAQGRGVGEALVRACVARAVEDGSTAISIFSRDFATDAFRLYSRLGFERDPERDRAVGPGIQLWAWSYLITR